MVGAACMEVDGAGWRKIRNIALDMKLCDCSWLSIK
jgi:hypothetical protein